jgi:hypothetical protein
VNGGRFWAALNFGSKAAWLRLREAPLRGYLLRTGWEVFL